MVEIIKDIFKFVFDFLIVTVVFKLIVGHWIAQQIIRWVTKESSRNLAIWQHWLANAKGQGHAIDSVLDCNDGACATF
jgi:hypothetical protein